MAISLLVALMFCASGHAATIMCDSNGVVYYPSNFWVVSGAEEMMMDIAEATVDTDVAALLSDYYTGAQSDGRYKQLGSGEYARYVQVEREDLELISGYDMQNCLESIDAILTNLAAQTAAAYTNSTNTTVVSAGSTNAADIRVAFTPTSYTPATNSVESHLISINSRLGYLLGLITNIAAPTSTIYMTGLTLTGNNLVYEGSTNRYYLTASYSDTSSRDVSGEAVYSLAGGPATAQMVGTNMVVGSVIWNTSVTVNAEYSWNGSSLARSALVQINDTNPPTLQRVGVIGSATLNERATANYSAWAIYDQGVSNNVTAAASWGFGTAVPDGTTITNGTLIAGAVTTNTPITLAVTYSTVSSNKPVTIANTEQHLAITLNNATAYNSGTLYIFGWDNRYMQGYPTWSWSFAYSSGMYGSYETNVLTTAIRQVGSGQYAGDTYWFAFLDTDGNGRPNGDTALSPNTVGLRTDEPACIMDGQTATSGRTMAACTAASVAFTLTGVQPTYTVQALPSAISSPSRNVMVRRNDSGGSVLLYYPLTNRTFICEQDFLVYGLELNISSGYQFFINGITTGGQIVTPTYSGYFTTY
jgi:hypothetical protein